MEIKGEINPDDYDIGVIIARFQVHELHDAHKALIDTVTKNHDKVIIFLGEATIQNTQRDPLDFATRALMVQEYEPTARIVQLKDQRSNAKWSYILDNEIKRPYGDLSALIYGGRDSFIPYYEGGYQTTELTTDTFVSGTEIRKRVSRKLLNSSDFRAGIIHANSARRPVTWSTVDVCPFDKDGRILLGMKPNEDKWRFMGGFLDRTDESDEAAAKRELSEEAGSFETDEMIYITSQAVDDWRYAKSDDGIMTRFFICEYLWGQVAPSDDISKLKWFDITHFFDYDNVVKDIMPEHISLMQKMLSKVRKHNLIKFEETK